MGTVMEARGDKRASDDPEGFGTSAGPVVERLARLGGVADRRSLLQGVSRRALERAVSSGDVLRPARDRYALPLVDEAVRTAHAVSGTLCLTSAALHHGWAVKHPPDLPHVSFPRNRRLVPTQHRLVIAHRHDLQVEDVCDGVVTSKEQTLLHCLRSLPEDEALAIADSAARAGELALLRRVAQQARGRGAAKVRRLAGLADPAAANAFESVLRSICLGVAGLTVRAQGLITSVAPWARVDLLDEDLRIVIEADSFAWHGDRAALRRDCRRYDRLVADGWIVLRFAWEDVMFDQDFVRGILVAVVGRACRRTNVAEGDRRPA